MTAAPHGPQAPARASARLPITHRGTRAAVPERDQWRRRRSSPPRPSRPPERGLPGGRLSAELGERHRDPPCAHGVLLELRHPGPFLGGHHPEVERGEHPGECDPTCPPPITHNLVARPDTIACDDGAASPSGSLTPNTAGQPSAQPPGRSSSRSAAPPPPPRRRPAPPPAARSPAAPRPPTLSAADQSGGGLHPRPVGELDLPGREVAGANSLHQTREAHTASATPRPRCPRAGHPCPRPMRPPHGPANCPCYPTTTASATSRPPPGPCEGLPDGEFGHGVPCSSPKHPSGVSGAWNSEPASGRHPAIASWMANNPPIP